MNQLTRCVVGLFLLAGAGGVGVAQEEKRPPLDVPEVVDAPTKFAPTGWRVEEAALKEADLNGDGRADLAMVISNGGLANDTTHVKHILILALRGSDGKLHRSIVSDAAVLDGDEGGVFGDPFEELAIDRGVVVITHYGGSRDRWSFTHRYRYQNNQWMLIGLEMGNTDTLNLEHYDDQDINLSTGLVNAKERGDSEGRKKGPEVSGSYNELQALAVDQAPRVDGIISAGEWPGYTVRLNNRQQVFRGRQLWRGASDLSALIHSVRVGGDLFLCAEVTDDEVTPGDMVRLVNKRGLSIKPLESKFTKGDKGYVFEARYSLKEIVTATTPAGDYSAEQLADMINSTTDYGDLGGLQMHASVEIVDVDNAVTGARGVLSTRWLGSPYTGAIRIYRKGTLVLVSDNEQ